MVTHIIIITDIAIVVMVIIIVIHIIIIVFNELSLLDYFEKPQPFL